MLDERDDIPHVQHSQVEHFVAEDRARAEGALPYKIGFQVVVVQRARFAKVSATVVSPHLSRLDARRTALARLGTLKKLRTGRLIKLF